MDFSESIRLTDHKPPWDDREGVWDKLYVKGGNSGFDFPMNIHIRKQGNLNQEYPLLFRDYLREHTDSAQAYYRLKCELARYHPDDIDAYCDIKDPACDLIMVAARDWAKRVGWKMSLRQERGSEVKIPPQIAQYEVQDIAISHLRAIVGRLSDSGYDLARRIS